MKNLSALTAADEMLANLFGQELYHAMRPKGSQQVILKSNTDLWKDDLCTMEMQAIMDSHEELNAKK